MKSAPTLLATLLLLSSGLQACTPPGQVPGAQVVDRLTLTGTVSFDLPRATQAALAEVASAATVSLIDAVTGNTVGSSVTDGAGAFVLAFRDFTPTNGSAYVLEAVKGLAVGGSPNRVGAGAVRVRTLLYWNGGWQSFTNSSQGSGITVSVATTALAAIVSHKQQAGVSLTLSSLINKLNGSTFDETGTGLSNAADFQPVLGLVSNAISLDQDPLAAIAYDKVTNTYALGTGLAKVTGFTPALPSAGGTLTVKGSNFDRLNGRNAFMFGNVPAATWSVSADKTTATVTLATNAYSSPFTLLQPNGVTQILDPFLEIRGTVGTLSGNGQRNVVDGPGTTSSHHNPLGVAFSSTGVCYVADYGGNRIRKVTRDGVATSFVTVTRPYGMAFAANGDLYVAAGHKILRVAPDGTQTTFAGTGTVGTDNGARLSATFNNPVGLVFDAGGNLYVTDYDNNLIRKIDAGGTVSTLATVQGPYGIALNGAGNLVVAANRANQVLTVTPAGTVTVLAGSGTAATADGTGTGASFNTPIGLSLDPAGNAYVTEEYGYTARKVTPGGVVTTLAGSVDASQDGPLASATFSALYHCAYYLGNLYIADFGGHRLRILTP